MKTKKYLLSIFFFLTLVSCEKQLNTIPTDFITSVNYYKNETQLNNGLASVYDILGDASVYGEALLSYMSYTNDEAIFAFSQIAWIPPSNFSYSANDPRFTNLWNSLYSGINRANIIMEAVKSSNASAVSESVKDNIYAQALFLRAYYYYMLVDRWGAIPVQLSSTKSASDVNLAFSSVADVYAQIVKDMAIAEGLLPQASTLGANSSGRLSKNTAQGILARVNLSMTGFPLKDESRYAEVIKWTNKVINTGENSLDPSYADLFVKEARDEYYVKENMWEVEFYGNLSDSYREQGYVGIRNGIVAQNGTTFPGYGYPFLGASAALYQKYQSDPVTFLSKDLRRERNIAPYLWTGGSGSSQIMTKSYIPINTRLYERWAGKWRRDEETLLPRFKNGNSTNFPLLRYSDVLLMFAEAENHLNGPTGAATEALNKVRRRAYGTGYRVKSIVFNPATQGGNGYTVAPIVTITPSGDPNGASTAEAYATIAFGKVSSIVLVNMGASYGPTPPVVTISSTNGLGAGATATAVVEAIVPEEANLIAALTFQDIVDERTKELAYECLRTQDLRRWGLLESTLQNLATYGPAAPPYVYRAAYTSPTINYETRHLYYPIPPAEMATNALAKQNLGW